MLSDEEFAKRNYGQTPEEYIKDFIGVERMSLIMGRELRYPDEPRKMRITSQEGARFKGLKSGFLGLPNENPYPDHRGGKHLHIITWSRGYQRAWDKGYEEGAEFRKIVETEDSSITNKEGGK